jgi:hypothetical protein
VADHVKAVRVRDNENKHTRNASLLANSLIGLRTGIYARVCFCPGHPKIL